MGIGMAREALENANITPTLGYIMTIGGGLILVVLSVVAFLGLRRLPRDSEGTTKNGGLQASLDESNSGL
jgi:hypothetical protein